MLTHPLTFFFIATPPPATKICLGSTVWRACGHVCVCAIARTDRGSCEEGVHPLPSLMAWSLARSGWCGWRTRGMVLESLTPALPLALLSLGARCEDSVGFVVASLPGFLMSPELVVLTWRDGLVLLGVSRRVGD